MSELEHVIKSGYCIFLGYNNVDWLIDEVIKFEKKWFSILKVLIKILY